MAIVYGTLLLVWSVLGFVLNKTVTGFYPELLIGIPPYRLPQLWATFQKLWMQTSGFPVVALPVILDAIIVINILYFIGLFEAIADMAAPVVTGLLGLPKEAVTALVIGCYAKTWRWACWPLLP